MESIKQIYRIGNGPSSSHTMGPLRAAKLFLEKNPSASRYEVTLYGSLAATGKGHMTDVAILSALNPVPTTIIWKPKVFLPFHPNGMLFEAFDGNGKKTDSWTIYSIGGGTLANEQYNEQKAKEVYPIHKIKDIQDWCENTGKEGAFWRIPIYSNTKLALWLFIRKLFRLVERKGIWVNAADPGIVSTRIITMDMWFDPLTDVFFRPFIRTPQQGAATAIHLLLDPIESTGGMYASCHQRHLSKHYLAHPQMESLWDDTEAYLRKFCQISF